MYSDCFDSAVRFDGSPQDLQDRLLEIPSGRGVLLFSDADDRPIQLLVAANLRRTTRIRLSAPDAKQPSRRARLAEVARSVHFRSASCEFAAQWDLLRIARRVFPDSYPDWILLPDLHLIQMDRSVAWPRFSYTSRPEFQSPSDLQGRRVFGPFPSRRACLNFIDILTRGFDLCRNPNLLDSADRARNCPYLQMGSCCAPCIGKLQRDEYGRRLDAAVDLAAGRFERVLTVLEDRMRVDARSLRFESANRFKQVIMDIHKIESSDSRWVSDLSELSILHIDRSAKVPGPGKKKVRSFAAFLFCRGHIIRLSDFTLDHLPTCLESVHHPQTWQGIAIEKTTHDSLSSLEDSLSPGLLAEQLALVASFLFRRGAGGLWFRGDLYWQNSDKLIESLSAL